MTDWGIGIKGRRGGRRDFLSMGGVWNTYGAGAENGIVKNCKIPPRQDRRPDTIRRSCPM